VRILPDGTTGEAVVGDRQLSLAIGTEGQNARMPAKLTGVRIDIKSQSASEEEQAGAEPKLEISAEPDVRRETPIWEELAQREEEERQQREREQEPAIAAGVPTPMPAAQPEAAPMVQRPAALQP